MIRFTANSATLDAVASARALRPTPVVKRAPKRARPARVYYTLAERIDGVWGPQFGDYDLETVEYELLDRRDHDVPRRDLKIVKRAGTGAAIGEAINKLNGR